MASRWDYLLDQKPVPIKEHLFGEVSRLLGKELRRWPLPVETLETDTGSRFAQWLQPSSPPPPDVLFEEAFRLTRWELEREVLAVDEYMRNQRWLEREGLGPEDKGALLFISRWLLEQLLALREETQSRVSRAELTELLDRIASAWRKEPVKGEGRILRP